MIYYTYLLYLDFYYNSFVDALLLEAVELDDLDSIEGILSWRNVKARKYREFPGFVAFQK